MEAVILAIEATRVTAPEYWGKCLAQRSAHESPCGSTYELTPIQLECALESSTWEEVSHSAVQAPCRAFKTRLAGKVGILALSEIPSDTEVFLRDPKGTGTVEVCIPRASVPQEQAMCEDTYMIAGISEGRFMAFTFHPGEPIRPSVVKSEGMDGKSLTVAQAAAMGFTYAKVEG